MKIPDPIEALKLGVVGIGFLLAYLAFLLLRAEQRREPGPKEPPRTQIFSVIKLFMGFSIVLVVLTFASNYLMNRPTPLPALEYVYKFIGNGDFTETANFWETSAKDGPDNKECNEDRLGSVVVCRNGDNGFRCYYKKPMKQLLTSDRKLLA